MNERACPYAGPLPLGKNDPLPARRREVRELRDLLLASRIVLLHGPSGAGKTSLIEGKGGLRDVMEARGFTLRPTIRVNRGGDGAGNRYLQSVIRSLCGAAPPPDIEPESLHLADWLESNQYEKNEYRTKSMPSRELLIFDQFEEVLTTDPLDKEGRAEFLRELAAAMESRRLYFLFVVRDDHLGAIAMIAKALPTSLARRYCIGLLDEIGAREAILTPASILGVRYEADAVTELVRQLLQVQVLDVEGQPEWHTGMWVEPVLLQVLCQWLWDHLDSTDTCIELAEVRHLADVNSALCHWYAHSVAKVAVMANISERQIREWVGRYLVSPQGVRAQVLLRKDGSAEGLDNTTLDLLKSAHLVWMDERQGQIWLELAHDRLVEPVLQDNMRWAEENLEPFLVQAGIWDRRGRSGAFLLSDEALGAALQWAEVNPAQLQERDRAFLQASQDLRGLERRARRAQETELANARALVQAARRQRRLMFVIAGLGLVGLFAAGIAVRFARRADVARELAAHAAEAASEAEQRAHEDALRARDQTRMVAVREAAEDPTVRAVLLREVERPGATRGWATAASALGADPLALMASRDHSGVIMSVCFLAGGAHLVTGSEDGSARLWDGTGLTPSIALESHEAPILSAACSPDGTRVATASADGIARVWRVDGVGQPKILSGHGALIWQVSFSPDGKRVVTASRDGSARVWDVDGAEDPVVLAGHTATVTSASFSPDGTYVVTTSMDGTARVWRSDGSGQSVVLKGHGGPVWWGTFSPDGRLVATASQDHTARVWRADGRGVPLVLEGHTDLVRSVSFSPDGAYLVTASGDDTARIWWTGEGRQVAVLSGHTDNVRWAWFSPDGTMVLTASDDGAARVWSVDDSERTLVLRGHEGGVWSAAFSSDGRRVATGARDGMLRLWTLEAPQEPVVIDGHSSGLVAAAFLPDGQHVVTVAHDGTAQVGQADGAGRGTQSMGAGGVILQASFSPDGRRAVTLGFDGAVRVWPTCEEGEPVQLFQGVSGIANASFEGEGDRVIIVSEDGTAQTVDLSDGVEAEPLRLPEKALTVAISPDGQRGVVVTRTGDATIWRTDGTGTLQRLWDHGGPISGARFSPDGSRVVTVSTDGTARLWRVGVDEPLVVLQGHHDSLTAAQFSSDGTLVVTASEDGTARVWSATDGRPVVVLSGHAGPVTSAAFSPDGRHVVTASLDGTARVWAVAPDRLMDHLWRATSYCLPVSERMERLAETDEEAATHFAACQARASAYAAKGAYR